MIKGDILLIVAMLGKMRGKIRGLNMFRGQATIIHMMYSLSLARYVHGKVIHEQLTRNVGPKLIYHITSTL